MDIGLGRRHSATALEDKIIALLLPVLPGAKKSCCRRGQNQVKQPHWFVNRKWNILHSHSFCALEVWLTSYQSFIKSSDIFDIWFIVQLADNAVQFSAAQCSAGVGFFCTSFIHWSDSTQRAICDKRCQKCWALAQKICSTATKRNKHLWIALWFHPRFEFLRVEIRVHKKLRLSKTKNLHSHIGEMVKKRTRRAPRKMKKVPKHQSGSDLQISLQLGPWRRKKQFVSSSLDSVLTAVDKRTRFRGCLLILPEPYSTPGDLHREYQVVVTR